MDAQGMMMLLFLIVVLLVVIAAWAAARAWRNRHDYRKLSREVEASEERRRATAQRRYITPAMKRRVLERDDYTCQICGISRGYLDSFAPGLGDYLLLEVDHIVPVAKGGYGNDESNLQTLCWRCNRTKGKDKTNAQVAAAIDYGIRRLPRRR